LVTTAKPLLSAFTHLAEWHTISKQPGTPLARGFARHIREQSARESAWLGLQHGSGSQPFSL